MSEHERCECGYPARDYKGYILCSDCRWRAPSWEAWDRVMRAARLEKEPDPAATIDREFRRQCAVAAMQGLLSNGLLDVDATLSKIAISAWKQADAMLAAEKGVKDE